MRKLLMEEKLCSNRQKLPGREDGVRPIKKGNFESVPLMAYLSSLSTGHALLMAPRRFSNVRRSYTIFHAALMADRPAWCIQAVAVVHVHKDGEER